MAAVLSEAAKGVAEQYVSWQGTYSAMFLMYLPPNIWGENAYHFVTAGILLLYTVAVFYALHPVLCKYLRSSGFLWMSVSSAIVLLTVQTTGFQGESFFGTTVPCTTQDFIQWHYFSLGCLSDI